MIFQKIKNYIGAPIKWCFHKNDSSLIYKKYPIIRSINTADKYDNFTFWKIMSTYIYSCRKLVVFLSAATGKVIEDLIKVQKRQRRNATNVTTVVGGSRRRESWQDTRRERTATNLSSARAAARLSSWRRSWRTTGSIAQALLTSVKNVEKF